MYEEELIFIGRIQENGYIQIEVRVDKKMGKKKQYGGRNEDSIYIKVKLCELCKEGWIINSQILQKRN